MQEKKIDKNQIIGFALMFLLFVGYYFYLQYQGNQNIDQEVTADQVDQQENQEVAQADKKNEIAEFVADSISQNIPNQEYTLENEKVRIVLSNQGAQINTVQLKEYKAYDGENGDHKEPLYLFHDNSAQLALKFNDKQGRLVDLSKRKFVGEQKGNQVIFTTQENGGTIQYVYTLDGDYDLSMDIQSKGLAQISSDKTGQLDFMMNAFFQEKGKSWEKRMTDAHYSLGNYSDDDYTRSDFTAEKDELLDWVAFKQQFFTTIIEKKDNEKMSGVALHVEDLGKDSIYSKQFTYHEPLTFKGEINENYQWHFLPLDFDLLNSYGQGFKEIIPFGWGIFGWINEYVILPVFSFMATWGLAYGWVIALLTIFVKLITSPVMYKQYKQSAMMKILKPDIEEVNKKYPGQDNAMKRQQETMKVYRTAGFNPLAGCFPMLLQMPIFYALFSFFPNNIALRGQGFLWANDLTAYDSILDLPFHIPFYGDHVSLFAILYVVAMIVYFRFSGNMMQQPQQEGMPDMRKLMYIGPIIFLFLLNSYASGLSWYYFVSNAINIGLVFLIKNVIIDEKKIHAKIEANKKNPKKKKRSKWQEKLDRAMKQAQEQQRLKQEQQNKK